MPEVSVIIPTYNRSQSIERAIRSVQGQTFQSLEIIVIDDGSTDNTEDIVKSVIDDRIRYIRCETNRGSGAARNEGLKIAQGRHIAFLDSDDEWLPEKLERQVERMETEPDDIGVCFCGARIFKNGNSDETVEYVPEKAWEHDTFRKFVMGRIKFLTPTVLIRKACLEKTGLMVPEMRRNQDGEFLLRLLSSFGLIVIPECNVVVHLTDSKKRRHYDSVKAALPYRLKHSKLIRRKLGRWPALYYRMLLRTNLLSIAIRERRWQCVPCDFLTRLLECPLFSPREACILMKAFVECTAACLLCKSRIDFPAQE